MIAAVALRLAWSRKAGLIHARSYHPAADHDRPALIRRLQDFSVEKAADAYLKLLLPDGAR